MIKEKSHFYDKNIKRNFELIVLCLRKIDYKATDKIANFNFINF